MNPKAIAAANRVLVSMRPSIEYCGPDFDLAQHRWKPGCRLFEDPRTHWFYLYTAEQLRTTSTTIPPHWLEY